MKNVATLIKPGSLVGADGRELSSAQVGISTVPPALVMDMLPPGICVLAHQRFGQLAGPPDFNGTEWALNVLAVELLEGYEAWLGRVAQEHRV